MRIPDLTKDEMIKLINNHSSIRQILITLGKASNGSGAYKSFKNHCKRLDIELPKFNKRYNRPYGGLGKIPLDEILVKKSTYINTTNLKNRLVNEGYLDYKCSKCGNDGEWMGKKLSLQLDHINGVNGDNRLKNLRLLCPNCHSQTKTYGGKKLKKINYCECGKEKYKYSKVCESCNRFKQRKVKRPPYKELKEEIKILGYCGTGRKYGVSDNAVRKWVKTYEKDNNY